MSAFKNIAKTYLEEKLKGVKANEQEAEYPHMMYHPETGEEVEVKTPEEHDKYAEKGYTHEACGSDHDEKDVEEARDPRAQKAHRDMFKGAYKKAYKKASDKKKADDAESRLIAKGYKRNDRGGWDLPKEEVDEKVDRANSEGRGKGYTASYEKGDKGYRAVLKDPKGKEVYMGSRSYKSKEDAEGEAEAYKQGYFGHPSLKANDKGATNAVHKYRQSVKESTKAYGKSMDDIADKKKKAGISQADRLTLAKLDALMKRQSKGRREENEDMNAEELSAKQKKYQAFFQKALKKFGVNSPAELKGDKKKEFFDYVDKNYEGDNESD